MKKNLILFSIFILLIVGTYFFQEKRIERNYTEALTKDSLIDFEVTQLKLPMLEAIKKDKRWWSGDKLLSINTFGQIEKKLSNIKKVKEIQGEWSSYFPNPFIFEINNTVWTIGDLSLDKQHFYIARGDDIYLARMEGESSQLTRDASEISSIKLNELVSLLSKKKENLIETQLFRFYPSLPLETILINHEGSLPFELDLKNDSTNPPPIPGVEVHRDLRGKFFSLLTQLNIRKEIPYSTNLMFKLLGSITLSNDDKKVSWELWLKDKDSADAVIIDKASKRAYLMLGGSLKLFFVQLQAYWDKKVIPPKDFVSFTQLKTTFIQGDKKAEVTVFNKEPLTFEAKGYEIQQLKMEQIFQFIFNLGPKDQADRVSLLSTSEKKQLLSGEHLKIEIMGQELILWRKPSELIVVNLTQGFKAHFNLLDENFLGTFEDVLK